MKRYSLASIFFLIILPISVQSQPADTLWTRTYGGAKRDIAYCLDLTSDGGYILTGETQSIGAGKSDVWLVKTGRKGEVLWARTYGQEANEAGSSVRQTFDNGYIIAGFRDAFGMAGTKDMYVIKTSGKGDVEWEQGLGGQNDDEAVSVRAVREGGYVVAGSSASYGNGYYDICVFRLDEKGNTIWSKKFGGEFNDDAADIQQTHDGGFCIAGTTNIDQSTTGEDMYVVRTDGTGKQLWARRYGGRNNDQARAVIETRDGGLVIAGYSESERSFTGFDYDAFVVRTNMNGDTLWTCALGGGFDDEANSVCQTTKGTFVIAGITYDHPVPNHRLKIRSGAVKMLLAEIDSSGSVVRSGIYGGNGNNQGRNVRALTDGGLIVAGQTSSFGNGDADFWMCRLKSDFGELADTSNGKLEE